MQELHRFKKQEFWKFLSVWKRHIYIFPPASCLGLSREKWGAGIQCQGVHYVCGVCYRHCWHILLPNSLLDKGMIYYISLLLFYSFPSVFLDSRNRNLKKKKLALGNRLSTIFCFCNSELFSLQVWCFFCQITWQLTVDSGNFKAKCSHVKFLFQRLTFSISL